MFKYAVVTATALRCRVSFVIRLLITGTGALAFRASLISCSVSVSAACWRSRFRVRRMMRLSLLIVYLRCYCDAWLHRVSNIIASCQLSRGSFPLTACLRSERSYRSSAAAPRRPGVLPCSCLCGRFYGRHQFPFLIILVGLTPDGVGLVCLSL
ncbi:MAG: hypothetical protein [Microviridae sp.]|nr:MAG: hypothetical protein [Microviridae sp.]